MTSDTPLPRAATHVESDAANAALSGLGYPLRTIVTLSATLALAIIGWVLAVDRGVMWGLTASVVAFSALVVWLHSRRLTRARSSPAFLEMSAATGALWPRHKAWSPTTVEA